LGLVKADGYELLLRERHKVVFDKRVYTENISYKWVGHFGHFGHFERKTDQTDLKDKTWKIGGSNNAISRLNCY
jgi:hypothetical protein